MSHQFKRLGVFGWVLAAVYPVFLGSVAASIGSSDRAYSTIADRNPFGLKPPPPPAPAAPEVPVEPPVDTEVKLTGISTFGLKRAYFMVTAIKDKKTDYYALGVDEKKDLLEVLDIDEVARSVRIRKSGIETLMTFYTHGIAAPAGASQSPTAAPGTRVGIAVPGMPGPTANTQATSGNTTNPRGIRTIPSRTIRTHPNNVENSIAAQYGLSGGTTTRVPTPETSDNTLSSEEQVLLMELRKITNPNQILPPTPGIPQPPGGPGGLPALPGQEIRY
ncbi:MAG: hypothetical protein O2960_13960 [Verrucomicrobia bacterium]|nr:hypothetical protein [Verrucomicrobiota bacterium]